MREVVVGDIVLNVDLFGELTEPGAQNHPEAWSHRGGGPHSFNRRLDLGLKGGGIYPSCNSIIHRNRRASLNKEKRCSFYICCLTCNSFFRSI